MRKLFIYTLIVVVALVIVGLIAWPILKPKVATWVEHKIQEQLAEHCPKCEFSMEGLELEWFGLGLQKVKFKSSKHRGQWLETENEAVVIYPSARLLLKGRLKIDSIYLNKPKITFNDQFTGGKSNSKNTLSASIMDQLPLVDINDGALTYIRDLNGTHAVLTVQKIQAQVTPLLDHLDAHFAGQVGHSGQFDLSIKAFVLNEPIRITSDMRAEGQNLADLNVFFEPNAGVIMKGQLLKGHALTKMRGDELETNLGIEFKDFKLEVKQMYDRDEVQTFLTNLAANIALRQKNHDDPEADKTSTVHLKREDGESLVSFILRSWKESALQVARSL